MKKTAITSQEAFGKVLREQRMKKGLSQEALALNCDLDRTFISMLERGKRQPSLASIITISKALSIQPDKLVRLTTELLNPQ
jgi:transcriptional regulator with XRE-family HTH domain